VKLYCIKECKIPDFGFCKRGRVIEVDAKPQESWVKFFSEFPEKNDRTADLRLLGQSGLRVRASLSPKVKPDGPGTTLDLS
jgi:hypothetical protein